MNALLFLEENYTNTNVDSLKTKGLKSSQAFNEMLDCDCQDGDCSIGSYEY